LCGTTPAFLASASAAIFFALLLPRGLWGTVEERFGLQLLPVGYRLRGLESIVNPEPAEGRRP
jgi:hypothetical protein